MIQNDLVCLIHKKELQHKIQDKQGVWKLVCSQCSELIKSGILNCEGAQEIQYSFQHMLNLQNDNREKLQNLKCELIPFKQKIEKFTELIDQHNQLYDQHILNIRNNFQKYGEMSLWEQMRQMNLLIMQTKGQLHQNLASICQSSELQKLSKDIENLRLFDESQTENINQQNMQQNQFNQQNQKIQQDQEVQKLVQQQEYPQSHFIVSKFESKKEFDAEQEFKQKQSQENQQYNQFKQKNESQSKNDLEQSKQQSELQQENIVQQQNPQQIQDIQQQQIIQQLQQLPKTRKNESQNDKEQLDQEQDAKKTKKIEINQNSSNNDLQNEIDQTQKIQPKQDINQTQKIKHQNNKKQSQNESQPYQEQLNQKNQDSDFQNQNQVECTQNQDIQNQNQEESKSPTQEKVLQINTLATIKQQENCWALAFNNNSQKLAVGFNENIKIFQIINGVQLKEDQILLGHTSNVSCIYFLNGNDNIISASYDYTIKIWEQDQQLRYINTQTLNEHLGFIQSLLVSQSDHLMISGSQDGSIKFWNFDKIWSCKQTFDTFANNIYCLNLNDAEYKLIASVNGSKPEILVIEQSSDSKWYLLQRIHLGNIGFRLCFIDNNTFTFQPNDHKNILTFTYNENSSEFIQKEQSYQKDSSIDSGGLFPQQFIKSKQLLITKQVGQIIILRKCGQNFQVEQNIKFVNEHGLYGALNKDGNLLALWSLSESELQLRRLED